MKKEELKAKAKDFWKENKNAIIFGATLAAGSMIGYSYAIRKCGLHVGDVIVYHEGMKEVIMDSQNKYGNSKRGATVFSGIANEAIKIDELGKLGEHMKLIADKSGIDPTDVELTHFIAVGPTK